MTEPALPFDSREDTALTVSASTEPVALALAADSTSWEKARAACRSMQAFGTWAGCGIGALGIIVGAGSLLDSGGGGWSYPADRTRAFLRAASWVLAFLLAGWGLSTLSRLTALMILEYFERAARASERFSIQVSQGLACLERIADTVEKHGATSISSPGPSRPQARALADVVRATCAADWFEAERKLNQLEAEFPHDAELADLRDELARTRADTLRESLAQLEAAKQVNDPDRVLEICHVLFPSMDDQHRTSLANELAKWFLSLIHRRLRSGKVQPDVVRLAGRFADTFGFTIEGASVQASLSTLRRSVGLCPRCAQPYTGGATVCPQCQKASSSSAPSVSADAGADRPA